MNIRIFLASSEELKQERLELGALVTTLNAQWVNNNITIRLVKWEYLDSSMGTQHKQEDYNDQLKQCDLCFVVYWTKFGKYTQTELDIAFAEVQRGRNPKVLFVFFKDSDSRREQLQEFVDHFHENYGDISFCFDTTEELKKQFVKQIALFILSNLEQEKILLAKNLRKCQKLLLVTEEDDEDYQTIQQSLDQAKEQLVELEKLQESISLLVN